MYKVLNINGEEYKLEFSVEASLYGECIDRIATLMMMVSTAESDNDMKSLLAGISDLPRTTLQCFYAGLMEHHNLESGDGRVKNLQDAKRLAVALIKGEDTGVDNWYDLLMICADQMREDGFFDLVGLGESEKKPKIVPQDHKRKTKASGN
jgi:hypothetical protein